MLAAVSWDGGGGDLLWGNPLNWSGDQLPGADDDVTVDAPGDATIVHDKSESSVRSLAARSFAFAAGKFCYNRKSRDRSKQFDMG